MRRQRHRPHLVLVSPDLFGAKGGIARIGAAMAMAMGRYAMFHGGTFEAHALHDKTDARDRAFVPDPHGYWGYGGRRGALVGRLLHGSMRPERRLVVFLHPNLAPLGLVSPPWVRHVVVAHGIDVWQPLRKDRQLALARAQKVWAVSRNTAWYLEEVQGVAHGRIEVVPNALSPAFSLPSLDGGMKTGRPMLVTVSRLHPDDAYKGIDLTLESLATLPVDSRPAFTIIGDGPDRPRLEALSKRLGVFAQFAGQVSDEAMAGLFREATAFVLPSAGEGFGLVYLEAMAHGLPCVAARAGGAPEVVLYGVTGLVVPPRDVGALAAAIVRVLGPEGVRFGQQGRVRLEREFLYPSYEARVHAALDAALGD